MFKTMIKKYFILFTMVMLFFGIKNQNVFAGLVSDCQSMVDTEDDAREGLT
ncbi:MAG: hypothetical protein WC422_01860 [Candidatus Paceibacterota bacterium]|jgi:hypothetical protein